MLLQVQAAIDTDLVLRQKFASASATLDYLTALLAAANVIYERDVKVRLTFSYVRLWSTTDPWTATDTLDTLNEVQSYWLNTAVPSWVVQTAERALGEVKPASDLLLVVHGRALAAQVDAGRKRRERDLRGREQMVPGVRQVRRPAVASRLARRDRC